MRVQILDILRLEYGADQIFFSVLDPRTREPFIKRHFSVPTVGRVRPHLTEERFPLGDRRRHPWWFPATGMQAVLERLQRFAARRASQLLDDAEIVTAESVLANGWLMATPSPAQLRALMGNVVGTNRLDLSVAACVELERSLHEVACTPAESFESARARWIADGGAPLQPAIFIASNDGAQRRWRFVVSRLAEDGGELWFAIPGGSDDDARAADAEVQTFLGPKARQHVERVVNFLVPRPDQQKLASRPAPPFHGSFSAVAYFAMALARDLEARDRMHGAHA